MEITELRECKSEIQAQMSIFYLALWHEENGDHTFMAALSQSENHVGWKVQFEFV